MPVPLARPEGPDQGASDRIAARSSREGTNMNGWEALTVIVVGGLILGLFALIVICGHRQSMAEIARGDTTDNSNGYTYETYEEHEEG